jgi:hypothetical protein
MKLTNEDLDILRELLQNKLKESGNQDDGSTIYINILKKLDAMYFA